MIKATRGRVRTPKVPRLRDAIPRLFNAFRAKLFRSAMRLRIAFGRCNHGLRVVIVLLLAITPVSLFGAAKSSSVPQLNGYKAVRVRYGPMNQMIIPVRINGQSANLLVDTAANKVILDADAASSFGIRPSQRGLRYIRFTRINGQVLPVGFAQSLTAGSMNFGSGPVTLRNSFHSNARNSGVDGLLGLDILGRYDAVINCRTKLVFFKIDQTRRLNLSSVALSEKFTRIPLRREQNGALTVPCSIHGEALRLTVDTGAFVTILHEPLLKSLGIPSEPTRLSAYFATGTAKHISAARISDLKIGDFMVPREKFGVIALPNFALREGSTETGGILGMDTLYICHAIIDLEGMNLFLK